MEEQKNDHQENNHSIRKTILAGVFVFAVAAIVSGVGEAEKEVALYPVEVVSQPASVLSSELTQKQELFEVKIIDDFSEISVGDYHPIVFNVEYSLSEQGFFKSEPDQMFDLETLEALKTFQAENNFPEDGVLTDETIQTLFSK